MIRVTPAPTPPRFQDDVRQPGLDAIAELVGEPRSKPRPGPKRKALYGARQDIRPGDFPDFWTRAIPDLRASYGDTCAYLAVEMPDAVGDATVDHYIPKSKGWQTVYEWSNYRLCAGLVNGSKGERAIAFDPFTVPDGIFALEFYQHQVVPGPRASTVQVRAVEDTAAILGLNLPGCLKLRAKYVADYRLGPPIGIALPNLERRAPFIAQELRRQALLVRGDR